jgi:hypothetical protein
MLCRLLKRSCRALLGVGCLAVLSPDPTAQPFLPAAGTRTASASAASGPGTQQRATAASPVPAEPAAAVTNAAPLAIEPLGQCSRRTSLVISEIMYHPPRTMLGAKQARLEYVELFNALGEPLDIGGYKLSGDVDYTVPAHTVIPGGEFLVIARAPEDLQTVCGISGVLGPWGGAATNGLPNDGGTIRLRHRTGALFLEVKYSDKSPWPAAADGAGHSLVLARPSFGEGDPRAWAASDSVGGSPGRPDPITPDPLLAVVINEFLAHTDNQAPNFVELYNHSNQPLDISGCFLSDDPETNQFVIPPGTIIPARGFVSYDAAQLGFGLKASGEAIFFRNAAKTRVLDAVRFDGQAQGVSFGRYPDGAPDFRELASPTPGTNNAAPLTRDIVINEIMYHPISRNDDDQYLELYNRGAKAVDLGGWKFTDGIDYTFPSNSVIAADGYLVVARNAPRLLTLYTNLGGGNLVGDFNGTLAHGGERIALAMPQPMVTSNDQGSVSNTLYVVVNEVTYNTGGRWPQWADGGGSSLELIDPRSDNRLASNWADSDETAKAPWTYVANTGVLDNPHDAGVLPDQLQVLLQGAGECLIDDLEVLDTNGANGITNSNFEDGVNGWTAEGTEEQSSWEPNEGFNSARCYHVRAVDRGDNTVNRIRTPLRSALTPGSIATIRAKVRWLRGHPEILFRLRGTWLEAVGTMTTPTNPGTPGARNSRAAPNAPPAIYDVAHYPILPAVNQPVVVTARVQDPDGLTSVSLRYRLDPAADCDTVPMTDDGTGGDAVAGDGVFSATIPGQATGVLAAFHVLATDGATPGVSSTFPNDAPTRECLIRFGETLPAGDFPAYLVWMTQATFNAWSSSSRSPLNNTPNDVTFALGDRRAIYNAQGRFAGSPYIAPGYNTPAGNRCGYKFDFAPDERFLGSSSLVLDFPGGHPIRENTALQENMAYWIADQLDMPFSHRYFIRLRVNGVTDMQRGGVAEAVFKPDAEYLKTWWPGEPRDLFFRVDRGYEFSDARRLLADPMPTLQVFTTPDLVLGGTNTEKKTARYRWNWNQRAYVSNNDYTHLFALVDAVNAPGPEPYTSRTEALVDIDEWMHFFALNHIINNFDSYGHDIGKNSYAYLPDHGKWQLLLFDIDWLMLVAPAGLGNYTATTGPLFNSNDPVIARMYNHPPFRRAYLRVVQEAVNGPLLAANCNPAMDAKYRSLAANGVTMSDGAPLVDPSALKTWFSDRRGFLLAQLAQVAADFAVSGPGNITANSTLVTLSGTAPVTIKTITVNGSEWPVTWNDVTHWTLRVPVAYGTNRLSVVGCDVRGNPVPGASAAVTAVYAGDVPAPPRLTANLNGSQFTLTWTTMPGKIYRIEYADDLDAPAWTTLSRDQTAADWSDSVSLDLPDAQRRFYRVLAVQ